MTSDRRTILIQYKGNSSKLDNGKFYGRGEIAKAFGISRSTVCVKLKGKATLIDDDLTLLQPQKYHTKFTEKLMTYMGDDMPAFKKGKQYTYKQISQFTGLKPNALNKRIGKGSVFNEHHIRPKSDKYPIASTKEFSMQFENHTEMVSAQWLRRKF